MKPKKIVVALSGGADSAAAAYLLKQQGWSVKGLYLRLVDNLEASERAAKAVADFLDIPLAVLDFRKEFKQKIITYFLTSYARGLTPNPCVRCNFAIKFKHLLAYAKRQSIGLAATGHYARIKKSGRQFTLWRGQDKSKDQTYFLYTLGQNELKRLVFPLADFYKEETKDLVKKAGLPALTQESQDICFLQQKGRALDHNEFLRQQLSLTPGPIKLLATGETIGQHGGLPLYTIGQRRGIKIGGIGPFYVAGFDYKKNILWVVRQANDKILFSDSLMAEKVNWLSGRCPRLPLKCQAVIRYGHSPESCLVRKLTKTEQKELKLKPAQAAEIFLVKFDRPQRAITPGQSVVFYQKDQVLGGGEITASG